MEALLHHDSSGTDDSTAEEQDVDLFKKHRIQKKIEFANDPSFSHLWPFKDQWCIISRLLFSPVYFILSFSVTGSIAWAVREETVHCSSSFNNSSSSGLSELTEFWVKFGQNDYKLILYELFILIPKTLTDKCTWKTSRTSVKLRSLFFVLDNHKPDSQHGFSCHLVGRSLFKASRWQVNHQPE